MSSSSIIWSVTTKSKTKTGHVMFVQSMRSVKLFYFINRYKKRSDQLKAIWIVGYSCSQLAKKKLWVNKERMYHHIKFRNYHLSIVYLRVINRVFITNQNSSPYCEPLFSSWYRSICRARHCRKCSFSKSLLRMISSLSQLW